MYSPLDAERFHFDQKNKIKSDTNYRDVQVDNKNME